MIPVASYHCRAALARTPTTRAFWRHTKHSESQRGSQLCLSSSSEPPLSGEEQYAVKHENERRNKSSGIAGTPTQWPSSCGSLRDFEKTTVGPRTSKKRERENTKRSRQFTKHERKSSLVHFSQYSYKIGSCSETDIQSTLDSSESVPRGKSTNRDAKRVMQCMDASALLDPLKFCKRSAKLSPHVHSGSRSISGADAAKRLLSGKRDILRAASKLDRAPVMLDGHGVPPALFQHCVDMAGALLYHYGPDSVECSFQNNYGRKQTGVTTPHHVRVRRQDESNVFLPPPNAEGENCGDENATRIDWNYHFALYLTVMERLAKSLGRVFELSPSSFHHNESPKPATRQNCFSSAEQHDNENDDREFDVSSSAQLAVTRWNVGIRKGAHFDFEPVATRSDSNHKNDDTTSSTTTGSSSASSSPHTISNPIRPFPVVEFLPPNSFRSSGRVLIRLQGYPAANREFNTVESRPQQEDQLLSEQQEEEEPVSLVFDACIPNATPMRNLVNSAK